MDLVDIFAPFQLVLALLAKMRFHIDNPRTAAAHATLRAPSAYNCYVCFMLGLVTSLYIYTLSLILLYEYKGDFLANYEYFLLSGAYFVIFVSTAIHGMLASRKGGMVRLVRMIRDVDDRMRLPRLHCYFGRFRRRNVLLIIALLIFHSFVLATEIMSSRKFDYFTACICVTRLSLDVDLLYCVSYLVVILSRLDYFKNALTANGIPSFDVIAAYKDIVKGLQLFNKIWNFQLIVLFTAEFYLLSRSMTIELRFIIQSIELDKFRYQFALNSIYLIRHLLSFCLPSIRGQMLANTLNAITAYCATNHETECKRAVCRRIVSLHAVYRPGFRVADFDALIIDGKWPFTVFGAFAACTVVMLGFEH